MKSLSNVHSSDGEDYTLSQIEEGGKIIFASQTFFLVLFSLLLRWRVNLRCVTSHTSTRCHAGATRSTASYYKWCHDSGATSDRLTGLTHRTSAGPA